MSHERLFWNSWICHALLFFAQSSALACSHACRIPHAIYVYMPESKLKGHFSGSSGFSFMLSPVFVAIDPTFKDMHSLIKKSGSYA